MLSRQIRALEDELKAQLFVRDKRATELTPAGRQLLADAGPLLASADALRRRVVRAARGPGSFTIGFMPGLIVTEAVRALAVRHPRLTVNVMRTNWDDQTDVLHNSRADVSYIRLPVGIAYSQVSDIPPSQVCLAWDATRRSQLIQDFAAIAADHPPVASLGPVSLR